jgi:hypothetical protein
MLPIAVCAVEGLERFVEAARELPLQTVPDRPQALHVRGKGCGKGGSLFLRPAQELLSLFARAIKASSACLSASWRRAWASVASRSRPLRPARAVL